MICASCLQHVPAGFRFCGNCGTRVTEGAAAGMGEVARDDATERRRLTVMFCDLVDSTLLSASMDPEDTHAFLQQYHQLAGGVVAQYGGYVAQHLGDGLLAYFGFPVAHEDDSARAIHAGLGIAAAITGMRPTMRLPDAFQPAVRVGIHSGEVVTAEIGFSEQRERLALGETPNVAARLQALAASNMVVVSDATRELAGNDFEYASLGVQRLRGRTEPIELFHVLRRLPLRERYRAAGHTVMVGRDRELRGLLGAFEKAQAADACVLRVLGEPGIGKTRLLMEFQAHLKDTAHHWLLSRCAADGAGSFLSPIRETLSEWAGIGTGQDPAAALEKLQAALPGANAPSAAVTCRALCRLLDIPPAAHEPWLHGTPEQQKNLIFEAVRDWLESLAHSAPLVYVVEDLHWADSSTLELLDYLRRALAGSHVAMVLAQRQEGPVPPWLEGDGVEVMALAPLSGEDAGRLVASSSTRLDGRTVGRIVERAGGIPLFLQELARVADEGDNEARPPEAEAVLPGRVRDLFSARLDKLGDSKPIAGVAAVIGHEFSADLLGKVAKLEPGELAGHLRKLTDTAIIAKINEGGYAFKHALIRDAALANLLRHRRRDHHARVAECLEADYPDECRARPERLAHHWGKAQVVGRALPYYVQAASRARAVYANAEALGLYLEALTLVGGAQAKPGEAGLRPLLLDAHEGLGDVQILLRRNHEAARAFTMAIDTAETSDRVRRARLNRKVGMASREEARHGLPYLHGALAELGDQPDGDAKAWWHEWLQINFEMSITYYQLGAVDDMLEVAGRIGRVVDEYGTAHQKAELANQMMLIDRRLYRFAATAESMLQSNAFVAAAESTDDLPLKAAAATARAMILMDHGRFDESHREFERAIDLCRRSGHRSAEIRAMTYFAVLLRRRGDIEATIHMSELARQSSVEANMPQYVATSDGNLAWVAWKRGDIPLAIRIGESAAEVLRVNSARSPFFWVVLLPLAAARLVSRDDGACAGHLERMLADDQQVLHRDLMATLERVAAADGAAPAELRAACAEAIRVATAHGFL